MNLNDHDRRVLIYGAMVTTVIVTIGMLALAWYFEPVRLPVITALGATPAIGGIGLFLALGVSRTPPPPQTQVNAAASDTGGPSVSVTNTTTPAGPTAGVTQPQPTPLNLT